MVKILSSSPSFVYCLGFLFLNLSINVYAAGSSFSAGEIVRNGGSIPHHRTKRNFALLVPQEKDEEESSEEHPKSKRCWVARPVQKVRLSSLYPEEITSYDNQKRSVKNYWDSGEIGDDKTVEKLRLVPLKNPKDNLKGFLHLDEEEEEEEQEEGDSEEDILRRIRNHLKSDDYKVLALVGKRAKNHPASNRRKLICYCTEANCSGRDCDRMMYRPCSTCGYPDPDWYSNSGRVPLNVRYPTTRNHFVDYPMQGDRLQGQKSRQDGIDRGMLEKNRAMSPGDLDHGRIFKVPVTQTYQHRPTNGRFISTDPRLAMNQYHPAIGGSGVIRQPHHEESVRFWPPGSQSSQHLVGQVADGPRSTLTNAIRGGNGLILESRPQVYPGLHNPRVPTTTTRKIEPQPLRTTQSISSADNFKAFAQTVTHYDSSTEYSLPSTDTLVLNSNDIHSDESTENIDKIEDQRFLDYNGVSDEPSRYKFPVVYTENVHSEEGNELPETWGRSTTLEPREFDEISGIVGSKQDEYQFVETTTSRDQSIQSTEYFDSDELKTQINNSEGQDEEFNRSSTTEDYSDIRVITNGYFTSEAFDDLAKANLRDFHSATQNYANTVSYEEKASINGDTMETQMESASITPEFTGTGVETSIKHHNDDTKNLDDDDDILSKIREKGDRTHDHETSSDYDSVEDIKSLEASSESVVSNLKEITESSWVERSKDHETTTSSLNSRRMPSEEIFDSYEPRESSEYRDSASIERVGDHESISNEEKSIYTTYEEEDDDDDDSGRLLGKHVDHDEDSVENQSVETCSMTHALNPDKTAIEYTKEAPKTPEGRNNGEYLTLVGEEPAAIDKSATKYFSPNDRVLEYIKKHSQNLVRDTEDYCRQGSTETPRLYHTQSGTDYPESRSEEILQRPSDLDEDVSMSEEERIIQGPESPELDGENLLEESAEGSEIAEDSFPPETNVQVSRNTEDSDHIVDLIQDHYDDEDRSSRKGVLLTKGHEEGEGRLAKEASEGLAGVSTKTESRQQDEDGSTSVEGLLEIHHLNDFSGDQTTETVEDSGESRSRSFEEDDKSATLSSHEEDNQTSDTTGSSVLSNSSEEDYILDETTRKSITGDSMVLEKPQRPDDEVGTVHVQDKPLLHRDHEYEYYTTESVTDYGTEHSYTGEHNRKNYIKETTDRESEVKVTNGRQSTEGVVNQPDVHDADTALGGRSTTSRRKVINAQSSITEILSPDSTSEEDQDLHHVHDADTVVGGISYTSKGEVMSGQQSTTENFGPDSTSEEYEDQHHDHYADSVLGERSTTCRGKVINAQQSITENFSPDLTSEEYEDQHHFHKAETAAGEESSTTRGKVMSGQQSTTENFGPDLTSEEYEDQPDVHYADTVLGGRSTTCRGKFINAQQSITENFSPDSTSEENEDLPDVHDARTESTESQTNHSVRKSDEENVLLHTLERIDNAELQNPKSRSNTEHREADYESTESQTNHSVRKSDGENVLLHTLERIDNAELQNPKSRSNTEHREADYESTESQTNHSVRKSDGENVLLHTLERIDNAELQKPESRSNTEHREADYESTESQTNHSVRKSDGENVLLHTLERIDNAELQKPESRSNTEHREADYESTESQTNHSVRKSDGENVLLHTLERIDNAELQKPESRSNTEHREADYESTESQTNHSVRKSDGENVLLHTLERIDNAELQKPESRSNTEHREADSMSDQVLQHRFETSSNSPEDVESLSDEEVEDLDPHKSLEATTRFEPIDALSSTILHKMQDDQSLEEMKSVEFVGGPPACGGCTRPPGVGEDAGYLGRLAPKDPDAVIRSVGDLVKSELYYIGDGVRLPLTIKKLKDGSFALSISDKVCKKRPCCVPKGGKILEERRTDDPEESVVHRRAADDESQQHKRVTRSIVMPVDEFVEKYNLVIDLDERESSLGHNLIQRDEEGYDSDLVGRLKSIKDLPEDQRAKVMLEALKEFLGTKESEVLEEEFRSLKSREEDGGFGFRYGYQRDNPILERIEMIKKLRDQMYECEHKYQKDCDLAITQKTELLKLILNWIKDIVS